MFVHVKAGESDDDGKISYRFGSEHGRSRRRNRRHCRCSCAMCSLNPGVAASEFQRSFRWRTRARSSDAAPPSPRSLYPWRYFPKLPVWASFACHCYWPGRQAVRQSAVVELEMSCCCCAVCSPPLLSPLLLLRALLMSRLCEIISILRGAMEAKWILKVTRNFNWWYVLYSLALSKTRCQLQLLRQLLCRVTPPSSVLQCSLHCMLRARVWRRGERAVRPLPI